ncbi:hypothetical protein [Levilactobacillus suantsaiihabitans]|uniref:Surface layer protein A domain-containing protein n=1 Tax=Levilactobacillus suantsaiihabitans TaxID=2487722 RepID=A0A4Z0J7T5_9LACO|nr:hypothetical protein [Levilactobacillus suantsaiihabitans]TGD17655.1 hypothetical protein EGT51_11445 [Levilactobacillus suantsaiihabitans]
MMKKVAMIAAAAAMVLPLGLGAIAPAQAETTAFAAAKVATKKTTLLLLSSQKMKKAAYHVKSGKPALYSGAFAADQPKVTLTKKGTLAGQKTYYATKKIVVKTKATKTTKAKKVTYAYVKTANGKVKGWVALSKLTAGKFMAADGKKVVKKAADKITSKTYTLVNAKKIKKAVYHFKGTQPAVFTGKFAADRAKVTLTKKGVLPESKTFTATKQMTIKQNKKNVKYLYISKQGWVKASTLTAGKFMAAD